ncbi:SwmB domain-containing protein [Candidatus Poriferisodalis sp.]|uniref:SwmB domain-containing protein n=1 Tax=Candidatus Poriferisodalis sp. TaxID=3101277 RepID=UPI003B01E3E9
MNWSTRVGIKRYRRTRAAFAAALLAAALLPLVATAPAQAQPTETTLVSNTGESSPSAGSPFTAQSFTTGTQGATVSAIQLKLSGHSGSASVKLRGNTTSGCPTGINNCPGDLVATFANPSSISAGINTFIAPAGTTLAGGTTYWVMIHEGVSGDRRNIPTTSSNNETGESGWTIGDTRLVRTSESGNWRSETASAGIAIKGTLITPTLVAAELNGTKLTMEFSENLKTSSVPAPGDFHVTVAGNRRNVASGGVAIANKKVTLTLASAVTVGQTVHVRYTKPTGASAMPLKNTAGVDVETFTDQPVTNKTAPVISSMEIVSGPRTSDGVGNFVYGAGQSIVVAVTWNGPVSWDLSADNAELRFRIQVGSGNKTAKLVTDGATSGTATTLWFSYAVQNGDTDTDGVAVVPPTSGGNKDRVVFTHSGAKLKGAAGTDAEKTNAGVTHSGLTAASDHKVDGSRTSAGNSTPTFDDGDTGTTGNDMGSQNASSNTQVQIDDVLTFFSDANGDNLRFTTSVTRPDALKSLSYVADDADGKKDTFRAQTEDACVLEDLVPALTLNAANQFENVLTITATDPDGASVSATATLLTSWTCREFVSATVNGATLTLTYDAAFPTATGAGTWLNGLDGDQFEVDVDGTAATLAQADPMASPPVVPVAVSGASITLTLATAVTRNQIVTVSYEPAVEYLARDLADQPVVNELNTAPTAAAMNGNTMTVTFNRNLTIESGGALGDLAWAFAATGVYWHSDDGGGVPLRNASPESAAVSGNTVTLTFGADHGMTVIPGQQVMLAYRSGVAKYFGAGLFDADGHRVPSVSGYAVTNSTPGTAEPLFVSGQVAGTELTLTFDSDLDSTSAPSGSRFRVSVDPVDFYGPGRSISGTGTATVNAKTVTVTLASAVAQGESATVWYRQGADAGPLRAASSGPTVKDIWGSLVRVLDRTAPTVVDSVIAGTSLSLYFSEKLDTGSEPAASAFSVTVAGSAATVSDVTMSDDAVTLTLGSAPADSDTVTVAYTQPATSPIRDLAGNSAPTDTSARTVTNAGSTDPGKPSLAATSPPVADQLVLRLTFDQALDPTKVPGVDAFTIGGTDPRNGNRLSMSIRHVTVRGSKVELRVTPGFHACGFGYTVSYTKPSENALRNVWGTEADSFSPQAVTNKWVHRCGRTSVSATPMSGPRGNSGADRVNLGFDRSMNRRRAPSPDGFSVRSRTPGGAPAAPVDVESIEFSPDGRQLQMALSRRLDAGEQVTVNYRQPRSNAGLWDADGNQIAPFSAQTVVPGAVPKVTGVEVISDAGDDDTYAMGETITLKVTFSDAVSVTGTPTLGIDMDPAHWGRKDAVYAGGSGTTELTFTHEVIWPNFSSQGIAVLADTLALAGGTITSTASQADADLSHTGLNHDAGHKVDWRQSPPDASGNRAPIFAGTSGIHDNALPETWVTLSVSKDDFSDPDGDELTFTLSASRDDVYGPGGYGYIDGYGRIWFRAKTACALAALGTPAGGKHTTVITLTATDPDGASASATATFRTDPTVYACPTLSSATVDGVTLTITLVADGELPPSYDPPTAAEFEVKADGSAVSLADTDAVSAEGTTIVLTLASPAAASQTVTVSYTPGDSPMAAAFADQAVTNNTPAPNEPASLKKLTEPETPAEPEEPACSPDPAGAMTPICAAVSGNELTLTFNRDLAALSESAARSLRWAFLVDGARDSHGNAVNSQSPSAVTVDGNTLTITLGTAIAAGNDATVSYYSAATANALQDTDDTPVADFAATLTTTRRE